MTRIGLSYHNGHTDYDDYAFALERRAEALNLPVEVTWLAGREQDLDLEALAGADAICLTGGADVHPSRYEREDAVDVCVVDSRRDAIEWAILEELDRRPRPTLAICRGAQILNVFYGGTLVPDLAALNAVHRAEPRIDHDVRIDANTLLAEIAAVTSGSINSSHHQAVERVAPGFRVSACAPDGVIEAFERDRPEAHPFLLAVQWHPERMRPGEILADRVLDGFLLASAPVEPRRRGAFPVELR
jgi:putative glutamine amidotransferase